MPNKKEPRVKPLPDWLIPDMNPAFYDVDSKSAIGQTAKLYAKMQELILDYQKFVDETDSEMDGFETTVKEKQKCFINRINEIVHDYIKMLDAKIMIQDGKINNAVIFLKDNLQNSINSLLKDMQENKELDAIILESFNSLDKRVKELEKIIPSYFYDKEFEILKINNVRGIL